MKLSLFNSIINLMNGHSLLYNSYSDRFLIFNSSLEADFEKIIDNPDYNRKLFSELKSVGAIVNKNESEITKLEKDINRIDRNQTILHIHVNPTLDCNLRCWYCYETHLKDSFLTLTTLKAIITFINRQCSNNRELKEVYLSFFGGEPLIGFEKGALPIIQKAVESCNKNGKKLSLHFTSNGTLISESIIETLKGTKCSFQITLDGGEEFHNKVRLINSQEETYRLILKNIKLLINRDIAVMLRINYTNKNIDSLKSIADDLEKLEINSPKFSIDIQRVWQNYKIGDLNIISEKIKNIISYFSTKGFYISSHYVRDTATSTCYGDKFNHVVINYDGKLYKCTAREFNEENSGYITDEGFLIYDEYKYKEWRKSKIIGTICERCRIAAICGGGCRQKSKDRIDPRQCSCHYTESDMDKIILDRFEYFYLQNKNNE